MQKNKRKLVYRVLAIAWLLILVWQFVEHRQARTAARDSLLRRAQDISRSVGVVIRAQGRFGMVRQSRVEAAMEELVNNQELQGVALLNARGRIVAASGQPIGEADIRGLSDRGVNWDNHRCLVNNPVDLGQSVEGDGERPPTIILPSEEATSRTLRPGAEPTSPTARFRPPWEGPGGGSVPASAVVPPMPPPDRDGPSTSGFEQRRPEERGPGGPGGPGAPGGPGGPDPRRGSMERRFFRPGWMSDDQYQELLSQQGLHGFVLLMSAKPVEDAIAGDLWLRYLVLGIALVAAVGVAIGWRELERSSELQIRLIRASEMNTHLREMNLAAAGLAHETKNPLNIVRGLAQTIHKETGAQPEIQGRAEKIVEEVDRVSSRLNEFINYSKPRQARLASTRLRSVIEEVQRTLESDCEDKKIEFAVTGPDPAVEADEPLLRQVLFNLLLNSVQSVGAGGKSGVEIELLPGREVAVEVWDDGPGIAPDICPEIFRPYFTTREGGTGLGLAIVRQIVLAHHWEIAHIPREGGGARFRITGIKAA